MPMLKSGERTYKTAKQCALPYTHREREAFHGRRSYQYWYVRLNVLNRLENGFNNFISSYCFVVAVIFSASHRERARKKSGSEFRIMEPSAHCIPLSLSKYTINFSRLFFSLSTKRHKEEISLNDTRWLWKSKLCHFELQHIDISNGISKIFIFTEASFVWSTSHQLKCEFDISISI